MRAIRLCRQPPLLVTLQSVQTLRSERLAAQEPKLGIVGLDIPAEERGHPQSAYVAMQAISLRASLLCLIALWHIEASRLYELHWAK